MSISLTRSLGAQRARRSAAARDAAETRGLLASVLVALRAWREERRGRLRVDPLPPNQLTGGGHAGPFGAAYLLHRSVDRQDERLRE